MEPSEKVTEKKRKIFLIVLSLFSTGSIDDLKQRLLSSRVLCVQETLASPLGSRPTMKRDTRKVNTLVVLIYNSD